MKRAGSRGSGGDRVWLVRHASTAWTGLRFCGRTDIPLSELGRQEAAKMAARLAPIVPDDVFLVSSPTARARETAERLLGVSKGKAGLEVDERLGEVDFGRAEGLTFEQLGESMPGVAAELAAGHAVDWPGGESAESVRARARAVWLDLVRDGRPSLVVSHGGLIRAVIETIGGQPSIRDVWIGPAAVVELGRIGRRWQIVSVESGAEGVAP